MTFILLLLVFAVVLLVASVWSALRDSRGLNPPPPSHFVDPRFRAPGAW